MPHVATRALEGWRQSHRSAVPELDSPEFEPLDDELTVDALKRSWERLLAKVYEIDAFVCPKCGCETSRTPTKSATSWFIW
jgi:hypothetical protein